MCTSRLVCFTTQYWQRHQHRNSESLFIMVPVTEMIETAHAWWSLQRRGWTCHMMQGNNNDNKIPIRRLKVYLDAPWADVVGNAKYKRVVTREADRNVSCLSGSRGRKASRSHFFRNVNPPHQLILTYHAERRKILPLKTE